MRESGAAQLGRRDVCLPAKSISQALLGRGRQLMGRLCYRTLKDTRAGHHHACPLYSLLLQGEKERDRKTEGGWGGDEEKWQRQKEEPRERAERFNNRVNEEVLPYYSFIIGLQGRSNERLLIARCSCTRILSHLYSQNPFKSVLGQMKRWKRGHYLSV